MNAIQQKLKELRNKRNAIKLYPEELRKPHVPKPIILQEEPTETFEMYKGCDIQQVILKAKSIFSRLDIEQVAPLILQVRGAGEIEWFKWFVNSYRF